MPVSKASPGRKDVEATRASGGSSVSPEGSARALDQIEWLSDVRFDPLVRNADGREVFAPGLDRVH